ncbi:MAG: PDZ domain-containing protein [Planctomycetes bacterium]|nr:PDZ domain-containing protein [Planctomycetota bacterium]
MKSLYRMIAVMLLLAWAGQSQAQLVKQDHLRNSPKIIELFGPVVAKTSDATVRVLVDGKEVAFGTVVEADGWIITKWSEIESNRDKITVKFKDGKVLPARLVGVKDDGKEAYDLALIKVEFRGLPTVQWRNSKDATVGKWVASAGNGAKPVAVGVVSVAARKLKPGDQPPKILNVDSGYLGVGLEDGKGGAKVNAVQPKSPAEKAGVKVNDIIYEAAGRKVIGPESLINAVGRMRPGDRIVLKIMRGEEKLELKATLVPRPKQFKGNPQETMGTKLSRRRGGFPTIIQHDSGVRPEDCGGPLVDLDGKTVGINIARAGRTETYAIPAEEVQALLPSLKSGKLMPPEENAKIDPVKNPDQLLRTVTSLSKNDNAIKVRPGRFARAHEVKLKAGETYEIEMTSGDLDSYLILQDAKGKKLTEDDDGGGFPNARIVFRAPADGTYRIIATTFNVNETGNYTLTVRKQPGSEK